MTIEDHNEPGGFGQGTEPTEEGSDAGTRQDRELDSDEEKTKELVTKKGSKIKDEDTN